MKLITFKPNTFLSLASATFYFTQKSKDIITVISVNNINSLLVKIGGIVLSSLQNCVGLILLKNKIPYLSKNIQRFILVGWIDRP